MARPRTLNTDLDPNTPEGRLAAELRSRPGLNQSALARVLGIPALKVNRIVRGLRRLQVDEVGPAAEYVGRTPEYLLTGIDDGQVRHNTPSAVHQLRSEEVGFLPVRGKVAAGYWAEVDDVAHEPLGYAPIKARSDIPLSEQWAEIVDGDSCNLLYPEGTILHVRSGWAHDFAMLNGRKVVVQRSRSGGLLIERTVKEVLVVKGTKGQVLHVELIPRSNNPKWKKFTLTDGLSDGENEDNVTVEISGVVIGSYRPE